MQPSPTTETAERAFDPKTDVTAEHLRRLGTIPEEIPDCAWVPLSAVHFGEPVLGQGDPLTGAISLSVPVTVSEPFRWLHVSVKVDTGSDLEG